MLVKTVNSHSMLDEVIHARLTSGVEVSCVDSAEMLKEGCEVDGVAERVDAVLIQVNVAPAQSIGRPVIDDKNRFLGIGRTSYRD